MGSHFSFLCSAGEGPYPFYYPYERPRYRYTQPDTATSTPRRQSHIRPKPGDTARALSPGDVYALCRTLSSVDVGLPAELALYIVQLADCRAPVKTCREDKITIMWTGFPPCRGTLSRLYLLAPPVPALVAWQRVKKVVWVLDRARVSGSDQPYKDSWFEASIFRRTEPAGDVEDIANGRGLYSLCTSPKRRTVPRPRADSGWSLVRNGDSHGWRLPQNHAYCKQVIEWHADSSSSLRGTMGETPAKAGADGGGFVEALQPGDRVGLWMRLGHKGTWNCIHGASFEIVYWDC